MVVLSDSSGSIVEAYSYDVFGAVTVHTGYGADTTWLTDDDDFNTPVDKSDFGNPYMFTGRHYDDETGLYYYRARMYAPAIGRFLQPDPIDYADSMNLYQYCLNSPINWVDPSGEGLYKWLYTGYWNAPDEVYDEATDRAAAVIVQWGVANYRAHKRVGVWIADAASAAAANAATFARVTKHPAELSRGLGRAAELSEKGSLIRRAGLAIRKAGAKGPSKLFTRVATEAKTAPAKAALKATVAGVAVVEGLVVAPYAGYQAARSGGVHTYPDGTTYDPLGDDTRHFEDDISLGTTLDMTVQDDEGDKK